MEKKKKENENEKKTPKKHKFRQLTPELSTQSSTLSNNSHMELSIYGHTITKSKNNLKKTKKKNLEELSKMGLTIKNYLEFYKFIQNY